MDLTVKIIYLVAVIFFIFGIKLLTRVKTARQGNNLAALGMLFALVVTLLGVKIVNPILVFAALFTGSFIGIVFSKKVKMTSMPELIAICNGVGGAASALVAISYLITDKLDFLGGFNAALSVVIGSLTFTGSLIAFMKLRGWICTRPLIFWGNNFLNLILFLTSIFFVYRLTLLSESVMTSSIIFSVAITSFIALLLGVLLVLPIGGADMPVVISLLNSYSGIAGAATGFAIGNIILIITGALIGASGIILTRIMCKAMNRSLANVLFGGFGQFSVDSKSSQGEYQNIKETTPEEVSLIMESASNAIIIPGYGMAVAQAQHAVQELSNELEKRDIKVNFAIHPVAGRMPGHMNVLLAEANISYDKLKDLDTINNDFKNTDVVYIIGANDVINPSASEDKGSPIYGMPILKAHEAKTVIVVKRSLSPGFAGVKNNLFEKENCLMLFGDAKKVTEETVKELKDL